MIKQIRLTIKTENQQAHLDIERDIQEQKEGLVTFNLRVNRGEIEDYVGFYTITIAQYPDVVFELE